jgi:hypothetical protein
MSGANAAHLKDVAVAIDFAQVTQQSRNNMPDEELKAENWATAGRGRAACAEAGSASGLGGGVSNATSLLC